MFDHSDKQIRQLETDPISPIPNYWKLYSKAGEVFARMPDGSILNLSSGVLSNHGRIFYVSNDGDDINPEIGNNTKPFKTYFKANQLAIPNDIIIGLGNSNEKNIVKDGVNYIIFGSIVYTDSLPGGIIDDSNTGQNGKIESTIQILGKEISNLNAINGAAQVVNLINPNSKVILLSPDLKTAINTPANKGIVCNAGSKIDYYGKISSSVASTNGSEINIFGNVIIDIASFALFSQSGSAKIKLHGDLIVNSAINAIHCDSTGEIFVKGNIINKSGIAVRCNAAPFTCIGNILSKTSRAIEITNQSTHILEIFGDVISEGAEAVNINISVSFNKAIFHGKIESKFNNLNGHGIIIGGNGNDSGLYNGLTLDKVRIIVAHANAFSIKTEGLEPHFNPVRNYKSIANRNIGGTIPVNFIVDSLQIDNNAIV